MNIPSAPNRSRLLAQTATGLALLLTLSAAAAAQDTRTWSDSTGKFKIEGKLLGVEGGKARLERKDGSVVQIDVKKLSAADQTFLKEQEEANPFVPAEASPFQPETNPSSGNSSAASPSLGEPKKVVPEWSNSEAVALMPSADSWKFKTPIKAPNSAELKSRAIPIPPKSNFFEGAQAIVLNASGQRALIGYALDEPKPLGTTRIVLCDLTTGKTLIAKSTPGNLAPVALHDKGAQVLMRRNEWGFGNQDRLELWNLSPAGITKVLEWLPYDDQKGSERDVKWGAFIDEERIATLGGNGKLAIWNAATAEPLFHLQIDGWCQPALTPDRKFLAFSTGKQIGILDLQTKEVVALQSSPHMPRPKLCFSPDATKLACLAHSKLYVWKFADGELYREIPLSGFNVGMGEIIWPHEKYLLLGKSHVFDVENQVRLWTYKDHELVESAGNLSAFVVSESHDRPGALVLGPIPPPRFHSALEKAMKAPDFLVLKEGTMVKINVDGLPDAAEREKVRATLAKKLQERGFQVGPQGTIELVASSEAGAERDVSYHGFRISPWKSYKVREYFTRLAFVYQGQSTWQTQGSSVPGVVSLKEGETIEQVLRRSERPSYAFFENVELPNVLMKPMGPDGLGASQVSIGGVQ